MKTNSIQSSLTLISALSQPVGVVSVNQTVYQRLAQSQFQIISAVYLIQPLKSCPGLIAQVKVGINLLRLLKKQPLRFPSVLENILINFGKGGILLILGH